VHPLAILVVLRAPHPPALANGWRGVAAVDCGGSSSANERERGGKQTRRATDAAFAPRATCARALEGATPRGISFWHYRTPLPACVRLVGSRLCARASARWLRATPCAQPSASQRTHASALVLPLSCPCGLAPALPPPRAPSLRSAHAAVSALPACSAPSLATIPPPPSSAPCTSPPAPCAAARSEGVFGSTSPTTTARFRVRPTRSNRKRF
jgi:hypothetical protein